MDKKRFKFKIITYNKRTKVVQTVETLTTKPITKHQFTRLVNKEKERKEKLNHSFCIDYI